MSATRAGASATRADASATRARRALTALAFALALAESLVAPLALSGCGRADPDAPPQLDEYYLGRRRKNVPFSPTRDPLSDAQLSPARRMDAIEGLIDQERYEEAGAALDRWIADGGDHPRAHYLRGRIAYGQRRWQDAIDALSRAVAASPHYIEPRLLLAQAYLKLDQLGAAESVYQELDRLLPKGPWGPLGMGLVALRRGDTARATGLIDEALARAPTHAPSLRARAEIAHGAGDSEREETLLLRFVAEEPDNAGAQARLGELAAAARRPDDARRRFELSYELDHDPAVARRLAELAQAGGDRAATERWQRRAGVSRPPTPAADAPEAPEATIPAK